MVPSEAISKTVSLFTSPPSSSASLCGASCAKDKKENLPSLFSPEAPSEILDITAISIALPPKWLPETFPSNSGGWLLLSVALDMQEILPIHTL